METWLTIIAVLAAAGMGWDLTLRFGSDRIPAAGEQLGTALQLVSLEEPAA